MSVHSNVIGARRPKNSEFFGLRIESRYIARSPDIPLRVLTNRVYPRLIGDGIFRELACFRVNHRELPAHKLGKPNHAVPGDLRIMRHRVGRWAWILLKLL